MIVLYIISLLLCFLGIWILKNSRGWMKGEPVLRMWHVLLIIPSALVPVWNTVISIALLIILGIEYFTDDLEWKETKLSRFWSFLNKRIS